MFYEACLTVKFLDVANTLFHILFGAQKDWSSLMDAFWFNVQDWTMPSGCQSARILHDKGHWIALVEEAKFSIWCICLWNFKKFCIFLVNTACCRVHENATIKQGSMHIGHHGTNIALAIGGLAIFRELSGMNVLRDAFMMQTF